MSGAIAGSRLHSLLHLLRPSTSRAWVSPTDRRQLSNTVAEDGEATAFQSRLGPPRHASPFTGNIATGLRRNYAITQLPKAEPPPPPPIEDIQRPPSTTVDIPTPQVTSSEFVAASTASRQSSPSAFRSLLKRLNLSIDTTLSPEEQRRLRQERATRAGLVVVFGSLSIGIVWFSFRYGRQDRDSEGRPIADEFSDQTFGFIGRIWKNVGLWKAFYAEPSREKLLPDPMQYPYIQPKYTIVLEMKDVLVHPEWSYNTGHRFKTRPALDYFLDVIGFPNFEVVIYTCENGLVVHPVIDQLDQKGRIVYRLYKDCTKYSEGHHIKDLSRLNRDLTKVIHIDFDPHAASIHPENLLRVPRWNGDMSDTALVDLAELLKTIYLNDVDDVRPTLQYYSAFDDPMGEFRRRAIELAQLEANAHASEQQPSALKRYAGRIFGFQRHSSA